VNRAGVRRPRWLAALLSLVCTVSLMVAVPSAQTAGAAVINTSAKSVRAPGVVYWTETWATADGPKRAYLVSVDLTRPGVKLNVITAQDRLNSPGETVPQMMSRSRAVAAVNGDFFDMNRTGAPLGGVVRSGELVKTPRQGAAAQLILGQDGRVSVRGASFDGAVRIGASTMPLTSVNDVADAASGGISELTHALGYAYLPKCTVVFLTYRNDHLRVYSVVRDVTQLRRLHAGERALLDCGTRLAAAASPGVAVDVAGRLSTSARALIGGARVVVRDGRAFDDRTGFGIAGLNPVTLAGVTPDGRHVLLAVVDGRSRDSVGLTVDGAAAFLLRHGIHDGLMLDGGGSSTMVLRRHDTGRPDVMNRPSDGKPRPVADGLFVYSD
jgi:hypothetical protein